MGKVYGFCIVLVMNIIPHLISQTTIIVHLGTFINLASELWLGNSNESIVPIPLVIRNFWRVCPGTPIFMAVRGAVSMVMVCTMVCLQSDARPSPGTHKRAFLVVLSWHIQKLGKLIRLLV